MNSQQAAPSSEEWLANLSAYCVKLRKEQDMRMKFQVTSTHHERSNYEPGELEGGLEVIETRTVTLYCKEESAQLYLTNPRHEYKVGEEYYLTMTKPEQE